MKRIVSAVSILALISIFQNSQQSYAISVPSQPTISKVSFSEFGVRKVSVKITITVKHGKTSSSRPASGTLINIEGNNQTELKCFIKLNKNSCEISTLVANTYYQVQATTVNMDGISKFTTKNILTPGKGNTVSLPSSINLSAGENELYVSWAHATLSPIPITSYEVRIVNDGVSTVCTATTRSTICRFYNLIRYEKYQVFIKSKGSTGESLEKDLGSILVGKVNTGLVRVRVSGLSQACVSQAGEELSIPVNWSGSATLPNVLNNVDTLLPAFMGRIEAQPSFVRCDRKIYAPDLSARRYIGEVQPGDNVSNLLWSYNKIASYLSFRVWNDGTQWRIPGATPDGSQVDFTGVQFKIAGSADSYSDVSPNAYGFSGSGQNLDIRVVDTPGIDIEFRLVKKVGGRIVEVWYPPYTCGYVTCAPTSENLLEREFAQTFG